MKEKIKVHDSEYVASEQYEMTYNEYRDDYQRKFDAILKKPERCRWLEWIPGGESLVLVQGPGGKRTAWSPPNYEDELIADLKSRFAPVEIPLNPNRNAPGDSTFHVTDDPAQIREVEYLDGGTQLVYPNYKTRSVLQYEMKLSSKTLHFSTTNRSRHDLYVGFADNLMLTTSDGAAWLKYEGVLYRIDVAKE